MTQKKHKKESLVTQNSIIHPDNGEILSIKETIIEKPINTKLIQTGRKYLKNHDRLEDINLSHLQRGYLWSLSKYIEYETGRLTISRGDGRAPIIIKKDEELAQLIGIKRKAAGVFKKELKAQNILFRIIDSYYINPTFIQYGAKFPVEIAEEMMFHDKEFRNWVPKDILWLLKQFKNKEQLE